MEQLSQRLRDLKEDQHLSEKALSELTGIPQPTIHRLLQGTPKNIHKKTVQALAHFFNISLNETILSTKFPNDIKSQKKLRVPILDWSNLKTQLNLVRKNKNESFQHIHAISNSDGLDFALIVKDSSLEPRFPEGTKLIFKLNISFKNRDYVLIESGPNITLKQLILDGNTKYVKSLLSELNYPISQLESNEKIIGVLAQAIVNYTEFA